MRLGNGDLRQRGGGAAGAVNGSATITIAGNAFTGPVRGLQWQISNQVDKNEQRLLPSSAATCSRGLDCALQLMAIDVDADLYAEFHQNNATVDAPAPSSIPGAIEFTFSSANDIPTGSNPYSLTVEVPFGRVPHGSGAVAAQSAHSHQSGGADDRRTVGAHHGDAGQQPGDVLRGKALTQRRKGAEKTQRKTKKSKEEKEKEPKKKLSLSLSLRTSALCASASRMNQ